MSTGTLEGRDKQLLGLFSRIRGLLAVSMQRSSAIYKGCGVAPTDKQHISQPSLRTNGLIAYNKALFRRRSVTSLRKPNRANLGCVWTQRAYLAIALSATRCSLRIVKR
jgi:hypothetical protein